MSRLFALWLWLYRPLCWIVVAVPLSVMLCCDVLMMQPRDVSGTMFGGAMGFQLYLFGWVLCLIGLLLALFTRMPGARLAWLLAGLGPLLLGLWWRLSYPDDADGSRAFSPQDWELNYMIGIAALLTLSGLYLYWRKRLVPGPAAESVDVLFIRTLWALILAAAFILPPLSLIKQQNLPHCAFNKAGVQLTVCLGDDPNERVIVD
ncbi:hypothetical protein J4P02_29935 [Pseudomonas sp. NFXW11]|uniref:hypothetical protein n=1 Tax=Pseudomonas sp. NFXW11 TaxID=2819531 RepID=UPI003CF2FF70